jgi:hypothetical protein
VPGRVPILRKDHVLEFRRQPIDEGNDGVALGDRERAAGHKVILQVDEQEKVAYARPATLVHGPSQIGPVAPRFP